MKHEKYPTFYKFMIS